MTVAEAIEFCSQHSDEEFLKFERIAQPRLRRPDMAGFLLLHALVPTTDDMISCAEHDRIYCGVDIEALCTAAEEQHLLELIRCGFMLDEEGVSKFV